MKFSEFHFAPVLQEGLESMGFTEATAIQEQTIPVILQDNDIIACAQTGTGKTASYLLPILQKLAVNPSEQVNAIILVPTRELAMQIDQQIMGLSYFTGASSIAVYGGGDGMEYEQQRSAIASGTNIIVATPGRLIAHLGSGKLNFKSLQHFVLDEADRMLDMGFYEDIERILSNLPAKRQNLLFSATMPPKIRTLAKKILNNPVEINIALSKPAAGITQQAYLAYDEQKTDLLKHILTATAYETVIVFASRKEIVKRLTMELQKKGIKAEAFHSDLVQAQREEIMLQFKGKRLPVLIGTDVISRGIDVIGIDLVVNYDVPPDPEDYIHRVGRTARASTTGTAITFINTKDQLKFSHIENLIGVEITKMPLPEGFKEGPEYAPKKVNNNPRKFLKKKNFKKYPKKAKTDSAS